MYKNVGSDTVINFTNDKHWVGLGQSINDATVLCKESDFWSIISLSMKIHIKSVIQSQPMQN